ncbi:mandelate racemase/muconate lactonizing enzyme family protein [Pseudonocardia cypriaca]|uniref:Galactonate dehydratase n=1 Tax=Pseudonocardia cypriaca TaxID=882449 RepID=A0A543FS96_9PSEU|nr:mandelate racemase/muconate lactonizing enzyme family protein [Pseudonocardia cypriaca]TQM36715.1 galactonate dehydratase [Pseudonocardia cypriaca]
MKIVEVVPWLVGAEGTGWGEYLFVEVRTDEDVSGWGEITTTTPTANRAVAGMVRQVSDLLVGDDPARIEDIWHKVFRAFTYMGSRGAGTNVVSAVDIALWDIRGKVLGLPVHELLGGRVRDDLLIYTHPDQRRFATRDGVVEEIRGIVDSGHTGIKFDPFPNKPGVSLADDRYLDDGMSRAEVGQAMELTALVREAAGPDVELLIDAHGRFDVPTAIRIGQALDEVGGIHWYEEPVPPESYRALQQVRDRVGVAISVGERLHTRWDFVPVLENRLADFVMPDVTWTGGISELKKIATMAEAYYVPVSPHDAAGPVNLVAGGQVMVTVPNFYRIESSRHDLSSYNRFLTAPLDNGGGRLKLPPGPGLGIEFDLEHLRGHARDGFHG